jgi:cytosine/adenosine deaminase-related metal-dependent hydrolase
VLGRHDIGVLEAGKAADFIAINIDTPQFAGVGDPVIALLFCDVGRVDYSFINGRCVVSEGQFLPFDIAPVSAEVAAQAQLMMEP